MEGQLPQNLSGLFGRDLAGWRIGQCHFLELEHTLMGQFPALNKEGEVILTLDKGALEQVWKVIDRRPAKVTSFLVIAHPEKGIAFDLESYEKGNVKSVRIFSREEILSLCQVDDPVRWAGILLQLADLPVEDPVFV